MDAKESINKIMESLGRMWPGDREFLELEACVDKDDKDIIRVSLHTCGPGDADDDLKFTSYDIVIREGKPDGVEVREY